VRRPLVALRVLGVSTLLAVAGVALGVSIAHAGYDAHQKRAPAARVALAAVALIPALAALRFVAPFAPRRAM
jgi:uncharacterized membrane protein (UPF0136 family)